MRINNQKILGHKIFEYLLILNLLDFRFSNYLKSIILQKLII